MKKKGKFLKEEPQKSEKPKKNGNPMKVTAIVLSSLAAVLVLAAVGVGIFVWYSGSVRGRCSPPGEAFRTPFPSL